MAEDSTFWTTDGTGDGDAGGYTMAELTQWLRMLWLNDPDTEGVALGFLNDLAITEGDARELDIDTGGAVVYGYPYWNTSTVTKTLAHPGIGTTGWRLVLRAAWNPTQTVRITLLESADGVGAIPAATHTAGVTWEISIAYGTITTGDVISITDDRHFLTPNVEIETAQIKDANVTLAKMAANSVDSDQYVNGSIDRVHLAADVIDGTKIDDNVIDSEHYVAGSIDREHLAADVIDGTKLANDVINSEHYAAASIDLEHMSANSVDSSQYVDGSIDRVHLAADVIDGTKLANDAVNSEHYADGSIDTAHLGNAQVTVAKMAANSVDSDQYVNASIDLAHMAANSVDSNQYVDGSIDTVHLSNNSVDDTKVGDRVSQFYRRQGGSATVWSTVGSTTRTPAAVRMQGGSAGISGSGDLLITFPVAFSNTPLVFVSAVNPAIIVNAGGETSTNFHAYGRTVAANPTAVDIRWFAIGPE